jgi:hypothetical protein
VAQLSNTGCSRRCSLGTISILNVVPSAIEIDAIVIRSQFHAPGALLNKGAGSPSSWSFAGWVRNKYSCCSRGVGSTGTLINGLVSRIIALACDLIHGSESSQVLADYAYNAHRLYRKIEA